MPSDLFFNFATAAAFVTWALAARKSERTRGTPVRGLGLGAPSAAAGTCAGVAASGRVGGCTGGITAASTHSTRGPAAGAGNGTMCTGAAGGGGGGRTLSSWSSSSSAISYSAGPVAASIAAAGLIVDGVQDLAGSGPRRMLAAFSIWRALVRINSFVSSVSHMFGWLKRIIADRSAAASATAWSASVLSRTSRAAAMSRLPPALPLWCQMCKG